MKRLNKTESPIFVVLCVFVSKGKPLDIYCTNCLKNSWSGDASKTGPNKGSIHLLCLDTDLHLKSSLTISSVIAGIWTVTHES